VFLFFFLVKSWIENESNRVKRECQEDGGWRMVDASEERKGGEVGGSEESSREK